MITGAGADLCIWVEQPLPASERSRPVFLAPCWREYDDVSAEASAMADPALRMRALSLYRSLIRSCRTWPGPPKEKQYIYEEASVLFRKDRDLSDPGEIAKKIDEGEKRYQIAWHYKIPYPRVHNLPLGAFVEKPETVYQIPSQEMGSLDDELDDLPGLRQSRRPFQA